MSKSILITGSTDGIGKLAAIKLAKEGHILYLHGRSKQKLSKTVAEVKRESDNENVVGFVADFSDLDAVKSMAEQVSKEVSKIDVLINNAGVYKSSASNNKDGLDVRNVVNYLAPYLLTNSLLPLLHMGLDPRIINVSSAAQSPVSLDVLSGKAQVSEGGSYAQSKLALTMWSFYLAQSLKDISVIAVNPGSLLHTKMALEAFGDSWASADKGADILSDLAISEVYKGITEKYFNNDIGTFGEAHADAYNVLKIGELVKATNSIVAT